MNKARIIAGLLIGLCNGSALPLHAQDATTQSPAGNVTSYGFDDDLVHGELARPSGEVLSIHQHKGRESLIRARTEWIGALLTSVENL